LTAPARLFAGDDPAESNQTTEPAGPGRVDRAGRKAGTARGTTKWKRAGTPRASRPSSSDGTGAQRRHPAVRR